MKYVSRERCSHVKFSGSEFNTQNLCKSRRKELFHKVVLCHPRVFCGIHNAYAHTHTYTYI